MRESQPTIMQNSSHNVPSNKITASFIEGAGWTMDQFPGGLPDKKLLDAVEPDRPVILKSATGINYGATRLL